MFPDLYLMRHGQTEWNLAGRLQGLRDSPLTARGLAQAGRQARLIAGIGAARYSSPQGRAVRTAEIVFGDMPFTTDDRLREIDVGEFTGHSLEDLQRQRPELFTGAPIDWYDRTPGGEHLEQLSARCRSFLAGLPGPALIVTHGITLRMLRIHALGWPLSRIGELTVEQGAVHVIRNAAQEVWR
ncbi:histidine phosphatase family protein [Paracoccus onubensis]|uniref:histidine phosphatase family protein n=1 Tax=Paracoccus onubensis TaxID=1675788 RepID=UPI0027309DB8|nr:histidine phosphatase family protein [Paracoccus onubensis]MDP0926040.1 histidine phosphatase family protein [Paracoccus onubensis]